MSQVLEQLNAEQERIEQEQMQSIINNCYTEIKEQLEQDFSKVTYKLLDDIQIMIAKNNILRIKDMHDFIYANPTLKGNIKELTWLSFVEIYKTNHPNELIQKIDHDLNPATEELTVGQVIDQMIDSFN